MGGETSMRNSLTNVKRGLSPRGRGNRDGRQRPFDAARSIPAWAGKPSLLLLLDERERVYPRVGGETAGCRPSPARGAGLSPRGRGNPTPLIVCNPNSGSIPAWAGKPPPRTCSGSCCAVYPRVGGETCSILRPQTD